MLNWYYITSAIQHLDKVPKEFAYAAAAGLTLNEIHKRHSAQKIKEAEINARVRIAELEVEKLSLQLDLHNARAQKPLD